MSTTALFIWLLNITCDTAGHIAFKRAASVESSSTRQHWLNMLSSLPIWLGVGCFLVEFFLWLALVSLLPLSVAAILAAFNIVAVLLAGKWIYGETLSRRRLLGVTFIAVGVVLGSVHL